MFSFFFFSCQQPTVNDVCEKFLIEDKLYSAPDTLSSETLNKAHQVLLQLYNESSIANLDYDAYHLMVNFGYGESIKFEKINQSHFLTYRCLQEKGDKECKDFKIQISSDEWIELENLIYEFDFWTEENYRITKKVIQRGLYTLEGNRPSAKNCTSRIYNLVGRTSLKYDKIVSLCEYVLNFTNDLKHKYEVESANK